MCAIVVCQVEPPTLIEPAFTGFQLDRQTGVVVRCSVAPLLLLRSSAITVYSPGPLACQCVTVSRIDRSIEQSDHVHLPIIVVVVRAP